MEPSAAVSATADPVMPPKSIRMRKTENRVATTLSSSVDVELQLLHRVALDDGLPTQRPGKGSQRFEEHQQATHGNGRIHIPHRNEQRRGLLIHVVHHD